MGKHQGACNFPTASRPSGGGTVTVRCTLGCGNTTSVHFEPTNAERHAAGLEAEQRRNEEIRKIREELGYEPGEYE